MICPVCRGTMRWNNERFACPVCGYDDTPKPLVEVPKHGRLIDADALKVSLTFSEKTAEWAVPTLRTVLMFIDEMPTIIPASEGGE